jgi:GDP/UDP-N,N'-diacetylbacillosamine 2-epimerase (hydrolysing)
MNNQKIIAIFTSARSEYGLLKPVMERLEKSNKFKTKLLVGGAHLLQEQGHTIDEIIEDGFTIDHQFPYASADLNRESIVQSNGLLQIQLADYFSQNKIDLIIVVGDRSELMPVVSSAMLLEIPIAHFSGGEVTEGSTDNQVRHAVTKMSHIHFPATETYKSNILRMGEEEWRICVSGEPGLDSILSMNFPNKEELFISLGLNPQKKTILATLHPETIENEITTDFIHNLINSILLNSEFQLLFTASNLDYGGTTINEIIEKLSLENDNLIFVKSLGKTRYYSMLKFADILIGNSSSGLIEAQSFILPVLNIGKRQHGRLRNKNVLDVSTDVNEILKVLEYADSIDFRKSISLEKNIYGDGKACERAISFLESINFNELNYKKSTF